MDDRTPTDSPTQHLVTEDLPTQHAAFEDLPTQHAPFEDVPTSVVAPAAPDPVTEFLTPPAKRTRTKVLVAVIGAGLVAGMLLATAVRDGERPTDEPQPPAVTQPANAVNDRGSAGEASSVSTPDPSAVAENGEAPAASSSSESSSGLQFQDLSSGTDVDPPSKPSQRRAPSGVDRDEMEDRMDRRF